MPRVNYSGPFFVVSPSAASGRAQAGQCAVQVRRAFSLGSAFGSSASSIHLREHHTGTSSGAPHTLSVWRVTVRAARARRARRIARERSRREAAASFCRAAGAAKLVMNASMR
jgi:hypothetical protein